MFSKKEDTGLADRVARLEYAARLRRFSEAVSEAHGVMIAQTAAIVFGYITEWKMSFTTCAEDGKQLFMVSLLDPVDDMDTWLRYRVTKISRGKFLELADAVRKETEGDD